MKSPLFYASVFLLLASCFFLSGTLRGADPSSASASSRRMSLLVAGVTPRSAEAPIPSSLAEITIPGPLRSFERMAGISQKISASEVLPLLAHNMNERGYVLGRSTEYLKLLRRYVQQAREMVTLAGFRTATCGFHLDRA